MLAVLTYLKYKKVTVYLLCIDISVEIVFIASWIINNGQTLPVVSNLYWSQDQKQDYHLGWLYGGSMLLLLLLFAVKNSYRSMYKRRYIE